MFNEDERVVLLVGFISLISFKPVLSIFSEFRDLVVASWALGIVSGTFISIEEI
ncbi:hypothetical protein JCM21531_1010 [Acetivibrio straminisolvens JCM 21531]|uniref:Uncharacterized protein n=1 Tax=Acetivibrio straminisolvens JCM 21531 TaxID=1294263 RepID=W4V4E9_9FIRM|nr:hypothetical protein JCM21531_1010 [Acetivibrio straminisolvens JCM 21531]